MEINMVRQTGQEQADTGLRVSLESGVTLHVREDGSAWGSDGKTYYPILREFRETFHGQPDVVARVVGWSSELRRERVLPLGE